MPKRSECTVQNPPIPGSTDNTRIKDYTQTQTQNPKRRRKKPTRKEPKRNLSIATLTHHTDFSPFYPPRSLHETHRPHPRPQIPLDLIYTHGQEFPLSDSVATNLQRLQRIHLGNALI